MTTQIGLIGFGEAASALVEGWRTEGIGKSLIFSAYDLKTENGIGNDQTRASKFDEYRTHKINGCGNLKDALNNCDIVFSLVTADQAFNAARAASQCLPKDGLYLDGNSCSPNTKKQSADLIEQAGGRYVDLAIMSPIYPLQHKTPMLLSGSHAPAAQTLLEKFAMNLRVQGEKVGDASSIKMIRSIMVKGMEALTAECVLAARKAGVEATVIASLQQTFPEIDWEQRAAYNLERMIKHGLRRSTEMSAVSDTLQDLNLPHVMADATVQWQQKIGELKLSVESNDYRELANAVLNALPE